MNRVEHATLSSIAEIVRGVTFSKKDTSVSPDRGLVPVLRAGNIQGELLLNDDLLFVPEKKISVKQKLRAGDIVMCTSSGSVDVIGKSAFLENDWNGAFGAFCAAIRANSRACLPRYLFHYLQTPMFRDWTKNSSGANIKNIRKSELNRVSVPLQSINEQRRIAGILDKADAIRRKRKGMLALANDIINAVFLERFDNPVSNSKEFPVEPIRNMGDVVTGNTPPRKDPANFGPGIEWIKSDNIRTQHHIVTVAKETLSEKGRMIARIAPAGATLVTCIAGSPNSIGNAALTDREVAFNQQINAVVPGSDVDPSFLYGQFCIAKQLVQRESTNSMKGMVSKGKFQEIEFICPPKREQREFGLFFDRMMAIIEELNTASDSSEALFNSLSQRAFRGELCRCTD